MTRLIDQRDASEKTRDALTPSMKKKIKTLIGKCEYCNTKKPINLLIVNHISEVATANGTLDKNKPGNLIVLDQDHHKLFHDREITKKTLKSKVSKRSEKIKTELRAILRNRDKINGGSNLSKPPVFKPPIFKPSTFKPPKNFF
ncbi:MAG: HNH endonuclease signature motif containing protein [Methanoregula sp.]|nr:HNH endonuclease signature motif containing protein [Methanoregula sp.]